MAPFVAAAAEGVSGMILNVFFDTFDRVEWFRSVLSSKPSETVRLPNGNEDGNFLAPMSVACLRVYRQALLPPESESRDRRVSQSLRKG